MKRGQMWGVVAVVVLLSVCGFAQQLATLRISVTDQTGAVIPGAAVTITSVATGAKRSATTGDNGAVVLSSLAAGAYQVTAKAKSFAPTTLNVDLAVGQVASLAVPLNITRKETVEVRDVAQGIDTEQSDVSQVIDTPQIKDLPISGRDFIDFVLLTPSVNVGRSTAVGAQSPFTETVLKLSFGGLRESHSSFFALDGIDYTTSISGVQRVSPSQDWVQEFRVVDSPYTADSGRSLGSVVNTITKSGTNDLHGSVYEFFRNNALDATNLLSAPGFNTYRFNQFGATLGGPIRKSKNFFFVGYEGQRSAESPIYSSFILNCIDESSPRFSQCPFSNPAVQALAKLPGPESINDVKQSLGLSREDLSSILTRDNYDKFIAKIDNVLTDRTQLNFTYLFNDSRKQNVRGAAPGEGLPSSYRDNPVRDQTLIADLVHVLSDHATSETEVQYGRRVFHLDPVGAGFEPALNIPNLLFSGGFVGSVRFYQEQHFEAVEKLTLTHGNHTFNFGGEIQPVWTTAQMPLFSPGFGVFPPDAFFGTANFFGTGDFSAADVPIFGPGTPVLFLYLVPRSLYLQPIANRDPNFQAGLYSGADAQQFTDGTTLSYVHKLWSLYAQDAWRARPNLTLTFGLHWDVDMMPNSQELKFQCAPGAPTNCASPTHYNNFQPRVGFAYSFDNAKWVVRGGAGVFVAPFVYSDVMVSWMGASEFSYMNNPLVPQLLNPAQDLIGFGASGAVGVPGPVLASPAFHNFIATGAYPLPLPNPGGVPTPQFPLGYSQRDFNNPFSEMASIEVEHQIGKDWYASVGYQYIHATRLPVYRSINGTPSGTTPDGKQLYTPADPTFGFALMVNPIGYSIYHAGTFSLRKNFSHNFNMLANYTWSKSIDIATTVNLPNTPQDYLNPSNDRAVGDNDVPHRFTLAFEADSPKNWPRAFRDFKFSMLNTLQSARYFTILSGFDTNGDIFPFNDRVDNIPRNTYKGDPYYGIDMRLQRAFQVTERVKLEGSIEAFNVINRVNVQDINHAYGAPVFTGPVPQAYGDGITNAAGFGTPKFVDPARQIQMSVRFDF